MENIKLTIFTPTYNRAGLLCELYHALTEQTDKRFIWLIVDDGSIDETKTLVENWIEEGKINIQYLYQDNAGKMMAHNRAVISCGTELFLDIDSDDRPIRECVQIIYEKSDVLMQNEKCYAMAAAYMSGYIDQIGNTQYFSEGKVTSLKELSNEGYHGETTLVFKTEIIKNYLFPRVDSEKFMPEGYIYQQIEKEYKLIVSGKSIVYGEYQSDGYTEQASKLMKNNPNSFALLYRQKFEYDGEMKNLVLCLAFHMLGKKRLLFEDIKLFPITLLLLPVASIVAIKRLLRYRREKIF